AGLLLVAIGSLVHSARISERVAGLESSRSAEQTAKFLQRVLREPDWLLGLGDESRFEIRSGRVVIPPAVGWIQRPVTFGAEPSYPLMIAELVAESRDAALRESWSEALEALDGALELDEGGLYRADLLLRAANVSRRAGESGDSERVEEFLLEVATVEARALDERLILGAVIHAFASEREVPSVVRDSWSTIDPGLGRTCLRRLERQGLGPPDLNRAMLSEMESTDKQRRRLVAATTRRDTLLSQSTSVLREGDYILFFYRAEEEGSGHGAALTPEELCEHIGSRAGQEEFELLSGAARLTGYREGIPPSGVSVLAGLAVLTQKPENEATSLSAYAAVLGIALFLSVGVGLSVLAIRRERIAVETRGEFLGAVTHELKTPLASIRLLSEMLERSGDDAERQRRYVGRLSSEATRLSVLVENVLDLGRLDRRERSYDRRVANLVDLVRGGVDSYATLAERDGIRFCLESSEERVDVVVDESAILQVLINLFENARRYSDSDRVDIAVARSSVAVEVIVRDYGRGVPSAERESIFERFSRGEIARTGPNPGVGLGLFLSRAIVRDHFGSLECIDPPGGGVGAAFRLVLPRCEDVASGVPVGAGDARQG
ncbi:MAG: HAMP domain-containing sensor histidine kinase, partial [Planctomycetota bacterium]